MLRDELPILLLKALAGGSMVVVFALVAEALKPKLFAGLFGAAPAVAIASLLVTALSSGPLKATTNAAGMVFGAVGMVAFCLCAAWLVERLGPKLGSVLGWGAWAIVAVGLFRIFLA